MSRVERVFTAEEIKAGLEEHNPPIEIDPEVREGSFRDRLGIREGKHGNKCGKRSPRDGNGRHWTCTQPRGHQSTACRAIINDGMYAMWQRDWSTDDFWKELGL